MSEKYSEEYLRRIHKVQDYIERHLNEPIGVEELCQEAGFSKYHFSRIFQSIVKESVAHYVNRLRMENALFLLAHREDKNMTDIAYELGYTDSAIFSRAFKNFYGVSPREYRVEYGKNANLPFLLSSYNKEKNKQTNGRSQIVSSKFTIEKLEEKEALYVRHIGTYESLEKQYSRLLHELFKEAINQQVIVGEENWVLAMYHDNPEFGEETQFRTSLCLTIPKGRKLNHLDKVGVMTIEGGLYAVGHFTILPDQYGDIWDEMYDKWLTCSEYLPRNATPFEVYRKVPGAIGVDGKVAEGSFHEVDIYVPIEPL